MYVDGVFSGGGVKAIAMLGALEVMEKRGLEIKRAVGTSAGSIIAAFAIAGIKSEEMIDMLEQVDLTMFLDSRKSFMPGGFLIRWLKLYWKLGLYRGEQLEKWVEKKLGERGIKTFGDIPPGSLRVIASDLTRGRLIVLPDDLKEYGLQSNTFSIAKAVRMSCSLPYFYEPIKIYNGSGEKSYIVDGGVLSNFPIWLFYNGSVPTERPVIGFKLSSHLEDLPPNKIKNAFQLYQALFETMKDAHDSRYISKNYVKNIIFIPTEHMSTTNFALTEEKKQALLELGREKAAVFFKRWTY